MTTRMIHPEHGATHAYDPAEVERLKKLGWAPEDELKQSPVIEPEKRKPGRPAKVK